MNADMETTCDSEAGQVTVGVKAEETGDRKEERQSIVRYKDGWKM